MGVFLLCFVGLNLDALKQSTFDMFGPNSSYEDKTNTGYKDKNGMVVIVSCSQQL